MGRLPPACLCVCMCRNAVAGLSDRNARFNQDSAARRRPRAIASGRPLRPRRRPRCYAIENGLDVVASSARRGAGPRTARGWRTAATPSFGTGHLDKKSEGGGTCRSRIRSQRWGMRPRAIARPARGARPPHGPNRPHVDAGRLAIDRRRPTACQISGQTKRGIDKRDDKSVELQAFRCCSSRWTSCS